MSDGFNPTQKQELRELINELKQEIRVQADDTKREIRDEMDFKLKGMEQRMEKEFEKLDAKIDTFAVDTAEQFDHVLTVMQEGFDRLDKRTDKQEKVSDNHEVRITALEINSHHA